MTLQADTEQMAKSPWPLDGIQARIAASSHAQSIYGRVLKRVFDLAFGIAILPIVGLVILVLCGLILREGKPAIYSHRRVGKGGKLFNCYKLRTMRTDADQLLAELCARDPKVAQEWNTFQKLANDPRITPIGRFLRASSLDELPQIFNVLKGDMSFVGPRPYTEDQHDMYVNAGGTAYAHLRPGITGIWQVEGRNATTFSARAHYDNDYGSRLSFALDIALILRTGTAVFGRTGK